MKGIFCKLTDAQTRKLANKYSIPEVVVQTIEQTVESGTLTPGQTTDQAIEDSIQKWMQRLRNPNTEFRYKVPSYSGDIVPSEDTIFVFDSNPEGKHDAGAAKDAVNRFGAKYGQGEGLQGSAYALPTKRIETHITPKLKGSMTYSFNGRQRLEVVSGDTIEAIINGERTATTRYESDGHIEYWSQSQVGDIVEFHKGKTAVFVRITKPLTKLDPKTSAEEWSKKEGWSTQYFNYAVKPKIDQAYQMEFEYVGAYGERTVTPKEIIENIKKLYTVASENPNKKFKIGYRNKRTDVTLNGYSGQEMMNMFLSAGTIPSNVVFSEEWASNSYFKSLYSVNQSLNTAKKTSIKSKETPILKKAFEADANGRGKLIYAQPGTGKTTISDNKTIIDGDFILSELLDCPVALVGDAWNLLTMEEAADYSKRYAARIEDYLSKGKTVITARANSLPLADFVIYRNSLEEIINSTSKERANASPGIDYLNKTLEIVKKEAALRNGDGTAIVLSPSQYLGDILLENPSYIEGSLQGQAEQRSKHLSLTEILQEFLLEFNIESELSSEIAEQIDIDALHRIIKAKTAEDLPEAAGTQLAMMSLWHPKMKPIVAEMIDKKNNAEKGSENSIFNLEGKIKDKQYKAALKDKQYLEYCNYIGKYMGQVLREEYGERRRKAYNNPSFIDKLLEIVRDIIQKLKEHIFYVEKLDEVCRSFSMHILANNPWHFKSSLVKPGSTSRSYLLDAKKVMDDYQREATMIKELEERNIYLAGSLSMAFQGDIYRPDENPVHDLDFAAAYDTQEELENVLFSLDRFTRQNLQLKTVIKDKTDIQEGHATYTYIYLDRPFVLNQIDSIKGELLDPNTNQVIAQYVNSELTIIAENTYGKMLDFFVHGKDIKFVTTTLNDGSKLKISHWENAMVAKIDWVRLKDLYDYNRWVTNEFKAQKKNRENALDYAILKEVREEEQTINYTTPSRRIDPTIKQYRYKMLARDFSQALISSYNDAIYTLKSSLEAEPDEEVKQKNLITLQKLQADTGLSYYVSLEDSLPKVFQTLKSDYQTFLDLDDEDLLLYFPTKHPDGANYVKEQLSIILDNFDLLIDGALTEIEALTGMRITIAHTVNSIGEKVLGGHIAKDENEESENNPLDENVSVRIEGNTSIKVRMMDNYKTLTKKVREIIGNITAVNANGETLLDDLGTVQYLNPANIYGILIDELSGMISPTDFSIKIENAETDPVTYTYRYPALEKLATKYAWVNQIIAALDENPRLHGAFYGALRRDFIHRYAFTDRKGIFPVNEKAVFNTSWKELNSRIEAGIPVSDASLYDSSGVKKDRIPKAEKAINDIIQKIDTEITTDEEAYNFATRLDNAFATVGFSIKRDVLKTMLLSAENRHRRDLKEALRNVLKILDYANKSDGSLASLLSKRTKSIYKEVLQSLNIASDSHNESTYRAQGATFSSHTVPGYIETLFKKLKTLKGEELKEFVEHEFKGVAGPFYINEEWKTEWLKLLMDPNTGEAAQQQWFSTCELSHINGKEYSEWETQDIVKGFLAMYLEGDIAGQKTKPNYGYFNAPIFSDSPVVKFVKGKRYSSELGKLDDIMIPLFREVVKQELHRIKHVEARKQAIAEGKTKKIANYDDNGTSFYYFHELNEDVNSNIVEAMREAHKNNDIDELNAIIDDAVSSILTQQFEDFKANTKALEDLQVIRLLSSKGYNTKEAQEEILYEYFMNQAFATIQMIQLLVTDPAYYRDVIEFQKRFKEVYAAGIKPHTETEFGKKTERCVYLKDIHFISSRLDRITSILDKAVVEGRLLPMDRDNILDKFKKVIATDGQAYRSLKSVKRLWDMLGKLSDVEASIDRIANNDWDMADFYTIFQTIKPFVFTNIQKDDGLGGKMRVGHQQKDSEFIMLLYTTLALDLNHDSEAQAIHDFMDANDIDVLAFESCIKTGAQGSVDLYDTEALRDFLQRKTALINGKTYTIPSDLSIKDRQGFLNYVFSQYKNGEYTQSDIDAIMDYVKPSYDEARRSLEDALYKQDKKGKRILDNNGAPIINYDVVHEIPFEDYCITMATDSEHLMDAETVFGTQFNTLITADLTDETVITLGKKTYKGNEIKELYQSIKIENILEDFNKVQEIFESPERLVKEIYKRVDANSKYNKGIKDALKLVSKKDPVTGNTITTFASSVINPIFEDQLSEIILSIFKNNITKQTIKGGTAYLVSDVGFTDDLRIEYTKDKDGNEVVDYIPCYLPWTMREMFKDILVQKQVGKLTYYELDINAVDPSSGEYVIDRRLLDLVGYRIPTEHKSSMAPLRIIGFLPQQNGSAIMLPSEAVTVLSGADYDIDKLFLMMYEYQQQKYNIPAARAEYKALEDDTVSFEDWYKENKERFLRSKPIYRKIDYKVEKGPSENNRKQRNNMLLDISRKILKSALGTEAMHKPQGFDSFIRGAELTKILKNKEFLMEQGAASTPMQVAQMVLLASTKTLEKYNEDYTKAVSLISPLNFIHFHRQNMAGNSSLGAYANNTTVHCKMQGTGIGMTTAFKFNGTTHQSMDGIYTTKTDPVTGDTVKVLISKNCCEGVGASADNAKQPTISTMNQTKGLIKLTALLMRLGLSMDDIALFFAQPTVAECIEETGSLDKLAERYSEIYGEVTRNQKRTKWSEMNISSYNFTSDLLATQIVRGTMIDEISEAEFERYQQWDYVIGNLITTLWDAAIASGEITKISRSDSTNGAIAHTQALAINQMHAVDRVQIKSKQSNYPLRGISGAPKNVGERILRTGIEGMRKEFANSGNPLLQAFHSCGIEFPQYILRRYYPAMSPIMRNHLYRMNDDSPSGTLDDKLSTSFLKKYVVYRLGTLDLFHKHGSTFMDNRRYYLKEFPARLRTVIRENPDIANLEIIQKIKTNKGTTYNTLYIEDSNLITEVEAERLRESMSELLYMNNPAAIDLAEDLFAYCYYAHSLAFLPFSFTRFFNLEFQNAMPGYTRRLSEIENEMRTGYNLEEFSRYWYNNNLSAKAVMKMVLGKNIDTTTGNDGETYYVTKASKNTLGAWRERLKLQVVDVLGTTVDWKALELAYSTDKEAYYREVPSLFNMSFYNPELSLEESIEIVKQHEEEDRQQKEKEEQFEASRAGVFEYFNNIESPTETEDFPSWLTEGLNVVEGSSNESPLDWLDEANITWTGNGDNASNKDITDVTLQKLMSEYPADLDEEENLCPPK